MTTCRFSTEYYNYQSKRDETYVCPEKNLLESGFCIFHDEDYLGKKTNYERHKKEVLEKLRYEIYQSKSQRSPLLCIGFHLPDLSISDLDLDASREFTKPVYFVSARFLGKLDFRKAKLQNASFAEAKFLGEADFTQAIFEGKADFSDADFRDASFYYAIFQGVDFSRAKFQDALFAFATFQGTSHFTSAKFRKSDFVGTTFEGLAHFQEATFEGLAHFYGANFQTFYGLGVNFEGEAEFSGTNFQRFADFSEANFEGEAKFSKAKFQGEAYFLANSFGKGAFFNDVLFEQQNKVIFNYADLSNVSFAGSDITRIRFGDKIDWGDRFSIIEEQWLTRKPKPEEQKPKPEEQKPKLEELERDVSLDLVLSVYRNLRENYEFRLRYDEAGRLFIKEMELKRKYRTVLQKNGEGFKVRENNWFRKHFSLTGLYYHFSTYGESIVKPTIIAGLTVGLSTLFWLIQNNPTLEPSLSFTPNNSSGMSNTTSNFINVTRLEVWNNSTHLLKSFERSVADFIPLLTLPSGIKVGVIDYIIKIVGGALTFGLLIIAFRRKFERKYTR